MTDSLLSAMAEHPHSWAVVDVETSGLRAARDRVLSVAVVALGPDGRVREEYSSLVDAQCDPGPVHVHGITRERLRGAPGFGDVAPRVAELLRGRVMVAHNAQFDYDFLAREFAAAGHALPVERRLCTLALNRRIGPGTPDLRLGTLAEHYGITRTRAHDALDDARVLAGVLRESLASAAKLGMSLPFVACPPRQTSAHPPRIPRIRCLYRNPGRMVGPLVQGMKVAFSGATHVPRLELIARAVGEGLNVVESVSRHTSVLVTNEPGSGTGKATRALASGVPVIDERAFLGLLEHVRPGESIKSPVAAAAVPAPRTPVPGGALSGRRVLVLGGPHGNAVKTRARVAALGGAVGVNLSRGVTDVILLRDGELDPRMQRIRALGLPLHGPEWLSAPSPSGGAQEGARVLSRGEAVDLPGGPPVWTVRASWAQLSACEVDVVVFALDEDGQVSGDDDFVFYGAPESPDGAIRLSVEGPAEQSVALDLAALPVQVSRVVVAAAIDGDATFGDVGAVEVGILPGTETPFAGTTLDAATSERTLVLAEIYWRDGVRRLRAVGQGHDFGLAELARSFGVDVTG